MSTNSLNVSYTSPTSAPFTSSISLPTPPSSSIADKAAYLVALREAVAATQDKVNQELTARMEEDKARDSNGAQKAADEEKEEENYGEEVQEED